MEKVPKYIIPCLRKYGNTIVTLKDLKKVGGEEIFLKILKAKGFDCELIEPMSYHECKQRGSRTYAHKVVVLKGNKK